MKLTAEQTARGEHQAYDPATHDFRWSADFTEVEIIPVAWHDDASYAAYQGDPLSGTAGDAVPELPAYLRDGAAPYGDWHGHETA